MPVEAECEQVRTGDTCQVNSGLYLEPQHPDRCISTYCVPTTRSPSIRTIWSFLADRRGWKAWSLILFTEGIL